MKRAVIALYWFGLVVGAGLLLISLAGDVFGDHAELPGGDSDAHAAHGEGMKILSMRTATYFLFGFGGTGVLLSWLWDRGEPLATAFAALAVGSLCGGISAAVFGYLRRSGSGDMEADSAWAGCVGQVLLPLSRDGTGKINVARAGREHALLARPFQADAPDPESWRSVVVIEIRNSIALVEPYTEP
jgi:hypothetical protein